MQVRHIQKQPDQDRLRATHCKRQTYVPISPFTEHARMYTASRNVFAETQR